jgi:dTDP-D-glucose 4,6-dehydratase
VRRHSRAVLVVNAENEIRAQVWKIQGDQDITNVEMLQILVRMQQSILKYMLRAERHPNDPDQPADLEEEL